MCSNKPVSFAARIYNETQSRREKRSKAFPRILKENIPIIHTFFVRSTPRTMMRLRMTTDSFTAHTSHCNFARIVAGANHVTLRTDSPALPLSINRQLPKLDRRAKRVSRAFRIVRQKYRGAVNKTIVVMRPRSPNAQ